MSFIKKYKKLLIVILIAGIIDLLIGLFISSVLCGLLLTVQAFALYLYLWFRALKEVYRPSDSLTGLRWVILIFISFNIFLLIPSMVYSSSRLIGLEWEWLRSFVNVTNGLMKYGAPVMFLLIFEYKAEENHK